MFGRFTLTVPDYEALGVAPFAVLAETYRPRYNLPAMDPHWVLRVRDGARQLVPARWGLVPSWAKSAIDAAKRINARGPRRDVARQAHVPRRVRAPPLRRPRRAERQLHRPSCCLTSGCYPMSHRDRTVGRGGGRAEVALPDDAIVMGAKHESPRGADRRASPTPEWFVASQCLATMSQLAPPEIMRAALGALFAGACATRNWTLQADPPGRQINALWEALHEIPDLLRRWHDGAESELLMYLDEYDAQFGDLALRARYLQVRDSEPPSKLPAGA